MILGTMRVRRNGQYRARPRDLIINWGSTQIPRWWNLRAAQNTLNKPQYVENASAKYKTLQILRDTGINDCDFSQNQNTAVNWLATPKYEHCLNAVVCRTLTRANSGRGIVLARTPEEVVIAPLYTRYKPKTNEYRVHVFRQFGVIDIQEKRKVVGFKELELMNRFIRNHPNGWVFCRENVDPPDEVISASEKAVLALNLDFGAVDIGWHPDYGIAIYEVNTAPGLEGTTLENYAKTFSRYLVQA